MNTFSSPTAASAVTRDPVGAAMASVGAATWTVVPAGESRAVAVGSGPYGDVYLPSRTTGAGVLLGLAPDTFATAADRSLAAEHEWAAVWAASLPDGVRYAGWSRLYGCPVLWSEPGRAFMAVGPTSLG